MAINTGSRIPTECRFERIVHPHREDVGDIIGVKKLGQIISEADESIGTTPKEVPVDPDLAVHVNPVKLNNDFFAGGKDKPECDYLISHHGGRWESENACSRSNWAIANINIQTRQIGFRMSGHDPGYPSVELYVTFTLSDDGQRLEGMESVYSKMNEFQGARAVRWIRRP